MGSIAGLQANKVYQLMQLEFCTPELGAGTLRTLNFPNVRNMLLQACLEAVVEGRRFTYTDIFMGVLPRDDEH